LPALARWIDAVFGTIKPFLSVFAIFVPLVEQSPRFWLCYGFMRYFSVCFRFFVPQNLPE
jgi:hypothetical protein